MKMCRHSHNLALCEHIQNAGLPSRACMDVMRNVWQGVSRARTLLACSPCPFHELGSMVPKAQAAWLMSMPVDEKCIAQRRGTASRLASTR